MAKTYKFYNDAGHGWMAVKRQELVDLGIMDKISTYSHQRGATVYLEEDCDAYLFIKAMKDRGIEVKYVDKYVGDRSPIRSYDSYCPTA